MHRKVFSDFVLKFKPLSALTSRSILYKFDTVCPGSDSFCLTVLLLLVIIIIIYSQWGTIGKSYTSPQRRKTTSEHFMGRQRIVSIDFHSRYIVIVCIIWLVVPPIEVESVVERKWKYSLPIQGEFILNEKVCHSFLQNLVFDKTI